MRRAAHPSVRAGTPPVRSTSVFSTAVFIAAGPGNITPSVPLVVGTNTVVSSHRPRATTYARVIRKLCLFSRAAHQGHHRAGETASYYCVVPYENEVATD
jgi:hypothetical protein